MRRANCKTVCQEIDEADAGQRLRTDAMTHIRGCAECKSFYDDRLKLRQLVAGMEAVEAPNDFDFRLRARLASEKNGARSSFMFGGVSFGLPAISFALVVLVIGAIFALRFPSEQNTSASKSPAVEQTRPSSDTPTRTVATDNSQPVRDEEVAVAPKVKKNALTVASMPRKNQSGIREFSATPATVVKRDALAILEPSAIFSVEASSQPLRVSLDDATGASRTISVPAFSFGSQRVVGDGNFTVRTSTKGVW